MMLHFFLPLVLFQFVFCADSSFKPNADIIRTRTQSFRQKLRPRDQEEMVFSLANLVVSMGADNFPYILLQQILEPLFEEALKDRPAALPQEGIKVRLGVSGSGPELISIETSPTAHNTGSALFQSICKQLAQILPKAHTELCGIPWSKAAMSQLHAKSKQFLQGIKPDHFSLLWALTLRSHKHGVITKDQRALQVISLRDDYADLLRALDSRTHSLRDDQTLGEGGYGKVYRISTWQGDSSPKALKIIQLKSDNLNSVRREIEALKDLQGAPNVIQMHAAYLVQVDKVGLQMELLDGMESFYFVNFMAEISPKWPHLPMKMLAAIIREIALGLKEIHSRGLIHSDLKWENVQIGEDGRVTILDLGLVAKPTDGDLHGTTLACAPTEYFTVHLAKKPLKPDPSFDIFQLGMMVYVFLTDSDWSKILKESSDLSNSMGTAFTQKLQELSHKSQELAEVDKEMLKEARLFLARTMNPLPSKRPTIQDLLQTNFITKAATQSELKAWVTKVMPEAMQIKKKMEKHQEAKKAKKLDLEEAVPKLLEKLEREGIEEELEQQNKMKPRKSQMKDE